MKGKFGNMSNIPIGRPPVHRHLASTRRKPSDHAACPRFEASRTHPELLSVTLGPRHLVLRPKPGKPATGWFCGSTIKPRMQGPASTPSLEPAKPFTSGARTVYSVLPRSSTRPQRLHRLMSTTSSCSFLPPCEPHLIRLVTGSLEPSLLASPYPGGHPG